MCGIIRQCIAQRPLGSNCHCLRIALLLLIIIIFIIIVLVIIVLVIVTLDNGSIHLPLSL